MADGTVDYPEALAFYEKLVAANPVVERKGDTMQKTEDFARVAATNEYNGD